MDELRAVEISLIIGAAIFNSAATSATEISTGLTTGLRPAQRAIASAIRKAPMVAVNQNSGVVCR